MIVSTFHFDVLDLTLRSQVHWKGHAGVCSWFGFFGKDHLVVTDVLFIGDGGSILKLHSDNCKLFYAPILSFN